MTNTKDEELGELLSAYLDGELSEQETAFVEQTVLRDAAARALLDELRVTSELVRSLPRHQAPDSICQDVTGHLEREELLGDTDRTEPIADREPRSWFALLSMAAMFALVATSAFWMFRSAGRQGGHGQDRLAEAEHKQPTPKLDRRSSASGDSKKTAATRNVPLAAEEKSGDGGAGLDVERKLAMGEPVDSLRGHAFDAERVHLRMFVGDADRQKAALAMLASHLSQHRVVDLQKPVRGRGRERAKTKGFYLEGARGKNFSGAGGRQILVRVPVDTLDEWLADVNKSGQGAKDVELATGAVISRGVPAVRERLRQMAQTADPSSIAAKSRTSRRAKRRIARAKRSPSPPTESPPPATSFIKELLKAMDAKGMDKATGVAADSANLRDDEKPGTAVPASVAAGKHAPIQGESSMDGAAKSGEESHPEKSPSLADGRSGRARSGPATRSSGVRFVTLVIELSDEMNGETIPAATAASPPAKAKGKPTGSLKGKTRAKRSDRSKPAQ